MSFLDFLLILVYLPLCLGVGKYFQNKHPHNPIYQKWFMKGLLFKLLACIAFCLVYTFYYDYGGDTRAYFQEALIHIKALSNGPQVFYEVMTRQYENVSATTLDLLFQTSFHSTTEYYTVNLGTPFILMGMGSYFSGSMLIGLFNYWGLWHFFLLFQRKFPALEKQMAFSVLFIPSVLFWGSGFNKDTFILCFVGLFLFYSDKLFSWKIFNIKAILIILITGYLIFSIKAYVLVSLIPAVLIWRTLYLRDRINVWWLRSAVLPIIGGISILAVTYSLNFLSQYTEKYSVENFVDSAQSMQGWHYVEGRNTSGDNGRGSSYTLGSYEETTTGLLKVFPAAVNVTFFRPYFWEVKNTAMLAQAIESFLFLFFTVATILKVGIFRTYSFITNDSFLLMCVIFSIFFGFAVGFSSYNFGALSRYKIQCVPFFVASLFILRYKHKELKKGFVEKEIEARIRQNNQLIPGFNY
ncbi:hypothetical protein O3Q51_00485 [Cryomorphaceae bacterium 1068]|nr:hypothetical protein [Cryomorphaceae bacterium 1068]